MKRLIAAAGLAAASAQPAFADVPHVVTDIAPVHSLVAQVMGTLGTPDLLIDGAMDPHSFQMKPSQARSLSEADLFVWVGPELTPSLERAIEGTGVKGEALALLGHVHGEAHGEAHGEDHHEDHGDEKHGDHAHDDHAHDDHGDEKHDDHAHNDEKHDDHAEGEHKEAGHDDHGDEHGDDHHGHDHGGVDPHAWLDPMVAREWLGEIALHLGEADPENAATYAANALAAQSRIDTLIANVEGTLADGGLGPVLVFHDAYDHFADRFGVEILGALKAGDHAAPSAAQIKELRDEVAAQPVACVFREPQQDDRLIRAVVEDTDVGYGLLDPTGATLTPGADLYDALILGMAKSFATCGGN
ncbi:zinc ABC transporter substrate-binding protein [Pseudoruegeria sp. SHC-113]|uniref:zinc ABC transporter substrate-binding protein n=1 Tax=Pseudoruegeria sp. SHC-113 TaxID=2855439 RepID=UPI0021BB1B13|nr:zinc ABC transporter substrate-binding protein [Pseudoruegeria sp. SHC-113]MCT8158897.1 zinc ABC transporter substrate-binding protein [Pseudoruegeria sp. SHC-113]